MLVQTCTVNLWWQHFGLWIHCVLWSALYTCAITVRWYATESPYREVKFNTHINNFLFSPVFTNFKSGKRSKEILSNLQYVIIFLIQYLMRFYALAHFKTLHVCTFAFIFMSLSLFIISLCSFVILGGIY